jgi:N-methylhydantoinase A/oxoprolinase/acetone carboxylase beta subunit
MKIVAGIDVGGTNTDAVLVRDGRVMSWAKVPTTPDVSSGIVNALAQLREAHAAERVHIGTTSFTNALIERRELAAAAALRLGGPVSQSLPPTCDWPEDLRTATKVRSFFIEGGREFDGRTIGALDRASIRDIVRSLAAEQITQVAVTGVFATSHPADELQACAWLREEDPALAITMSHRIGRFGILERENATLLNAMLQPLAARTIAAYREAVSTRLFISQNDGTVVRSDNASEMPIFTVASGPTNSLRGASILAGSRDAIVLDVGGTTTDAGVIHGGYPQPAGLELTVAGVRTNFRMPDLYSTGVGGGSLIDEATGAVGPRSVGFRLISEALVFGGKTLTLTDIAVAAGRLAIGDPTRVAHLDRSLISRVDDHLRRRFERLLENYERSNQQLPVILVGGGAALIDELLRSMRRAVVRPEHAGIANALGAAMAQVGGEADLTFSTAEVSRDEALTRAEREAHRRAVAAGAKAASTVTVELEDAALSYLAADALRVRARAIGDIDESEQ